MNDRAIITVAENAEDNHIINGENEVPNMVDTATVVDESNKVCTQEQFDAMSTEKKIETFNNYSEVIELAAKQTSIQREVGEVLEKRSGVGNYMKPSVAIDPMDLVNKKLATIGSVEILKKDYLPYPEKVAWFFTDDDTGELVEFVLPDDTKAGQDLYTFQKDMLMFLKQCDDALDEYDRMSKEAEKELKEINASIDEINVLMGNNVLAFAEALRESVTPDSPNYREVIDMSDGIQSGYNFSMIFESLEKYPTTIDNTVREFKSTHRIKAIGDKYVTRLAKSNTFTNLIIFLQKKQGNKSIEELIIPRDYRPGTEDLFIFIMIRWFSINRLEDTKSRKFHAVLYYVISQLTTNQLPDSTLDMVIGNMKKLLNIFYEKM